MAIAEYYDRVALAASQIIAGFTPDLFRRTLEETNVGVAIDREASSTSEGRALADLTVRLLARLYPVLDLRVQSSEEGTRLENLAREINPRIEFRGDAEIGVRVGAGSSVFPTTFFAGSDGWDAILSASGPVLTGSTPNPLGAGAAACLVVSNIFNHILLPESGRHPIADVRLSTFVLEKGQTPESIPNGDWRLAGDAVLVGVGAVGNGAAWALGRAPIEGRIHLVDHEPLELSNLQRYVLGVHRDVGKLKVNIAKEQFCGRFTCVPHAMNWAEFLQNNGYNQRHVLVAVDSAEARRSVQAALPEWIANAWTQPGDLGVSVHDRFDGVGACLACLYLPTGAAPNEDELVADALGIPELVTEVRTLLHNGAGVSRLLLQAVAQGRNLQLEAVLPYEGRSIKDLYVQGICGGGLIPLGAIGLPRQELHVPLAHQSTLAGILLSGSLVRRALGTPTTTTMTTRIDIGKPLGDFLTQPTLKGRTGRCICEDQDYIAAFRMKFGKDSR